MKKIIILSIISLIFFLLGCNRILTKKENVSHEPPKIFREVSNVSVLLDGADLGTGENPKQRLIEEGAKKGILNISKKWLDQSLIFKVSDQSINAKEEINFTQSLVKFDAKYDEVTNIYEADFVFDATMIPSMDYAGTIIGIEGGYSLATSNIVIKLEGVLPKDEPYFVIAKKNDFKVGDYYQVIGVGKIYNRMGMIVQGKIVSSSREIKVGDYIFLLHTKIFGEKKVKVNSDQKVNEVVVKPIVETKPEEPKEMK